MNLALYSFKTHHINVPFFTKATHFFGGNAIVKNILSLMINYCIARCTLLAKDECWKVSSFDLSDNKISRISFFYHIHAFIYEVDLKLSICFFWAYSERITLNTDVKTKLIKSTSSCHNENHYNCGVFRHSIMNWVFIFYS